MPECSRLSVATPSFNAGRFLGYFRSAWQRLRLALQPRLGVPNQYAPRTLTIPQHYRGALAPHPAPTISIVTPSYNQGAFLAATIESILGQRYPNLEYVIQDGGSSDETLTILERYRGRLTHCESAPDGGQA